VSVTWYGITVTVEAGLSSATGIYATWDTSLWDTGTWGPDNTWVDISQFVMSIETDRHFERDVQSWEAGSAKIVLKNTDGRFSPDNLTGPYAVGGITGIRPWRPIRVSVFGNPIYTGYALSWNESYSRAHAMAVVTVDCLDEFASLARFDGFETSEVGAGEMSGLRIHRLLDNAGHIGERAIEPGRFTVQGTTLADNALSELKMTSDSEGGALWVEADGSVWFENRYALVENFRSRVIQATFGDGTNGNDLPCTDIRTSYDGDLVANFVSCNRMGGAVQRVDDPTSRALYGDSVAGHTDLLLETDSDVLALCQLELLVHKDAELRVESITFMPRRPDRSGALILHGIGRHVRDLIRVNLTPASGIPITRDCFIAGIKHTITPEGVWEITWDLQSAKPWTGFTSSLWDTAVFDTDLWFV